MSSPAARRRGPITGGWPVVQSVELLLDGALDAAVRRQWDLLAAAGLPSLARHAGSANRPHVTLAVSSRPWPGDVEAAVARAVTGLPLPVRLGGVVVFAHGRRCVLARLAVPSADLLALQSRVSAAVRDAPGAVPHTAPGGWTPHVTLARGLPVERLGEAVAALGPATERPGHGVTARRWDGDARHEWPLVPPPADQDPHRP